MHIQSSTPNFHTKDLRKGRHSEPAHTYLVTAITAQRKPIFATFDLARLLIAELRAAETSGSIQSLAWVVMPDHMHWLITLQSGDLSSLMRGVKGRSAISINRALAQQGSIWQKEFHDHALRKEEDLHAIARYIVANPLRAGLVERIGDYPLWDAVWLK